jgi:hypothetical protein
MGQPPELAGLKCPGLLCQAFVYDGQLIEGANIVHRKFEDTWHRLNFDRGVIFWKQSDEPPGSWASKEAGWEYPRVDVGGSAGVIGKLQDYYEMAATSTGGCVVFVLVSGRKMIIDNVDNRSSYRLAEQPS